MVVCLGTSVGRPLGGPALMAVLLSKLLPLTTGGTL